MTPRCSSLRTRSAAEGAERPRSWPSSAQVARPLRIRRFKALTSKDLMGISLRNNGIDMIFPSIHNTRTIRRWESNGHAFYRIWKHGFQQTRAEPGDVRVAGERERAATIRGSVEIGKAAKGGVDTRSTRSDGGVLCVRPCGGRNVRDYESWDFAPQYVRGYAEYGGQRLPRNIDEILGRRDRRVHSVWPLPVAIGSGARGGCGVRCGPRPVPTVLQV